MKETVKITCNNFVKTNTGRIYIEPAIEVELDTGRVLGWNEGNTSSGVFLVKTLYECTFRNSENLLRISQLSLKQFLDVSDDAHFIRLDINHKGMIKNWNFQTIPIFCEIAE